jgi:hypothetical protein
MSAHGTPRGTRPARARPQRVEGAVAVGHRLLAGVAGHHAQRHAPPGVLGHARGALQVVARLGLGLGAAQVVELGLAGLGVRLRDPAREPVRAPPEAILSSSPCRSTAARILTNRHPGAHHERLRCARRFDRARTVGGHLRTRRVGQGHLLGNLARSRRSLTQRSADLRRPADAREPWQYGYGRMPSGWLAPWTRPERLAHRRDDACSPRRSESSAA